MSRTDEVYVDDIKESIEVILNYVDGKSESDFNSNMMLQDAVIRRFEIIGEAAGKLSDAFVLKNSFVAWRILKDMRNKLIHEYFGVSAATIYATTQIDLPILEEQLKKLVP